MRRAGAGARADEEGREVNTKAATGEQLQHTCILSIMANRSVLWGKRVDTKSKKRTREFDSSPLPPLIFHPCSTGVPPAPFRSEGKIRASDV